MCSEKGICGSGVARIYQANENNIKVLAVKLRCGRWDCPSCAAHKARLIQERLKKFLAANKCWMYTFTFYQDKPPEQKWREMPKIWNLFRTRVTQKYGKFSYIRVVESHKKTPYPHLHVVANVDIPESEFGELAVECGFGYQLKKRECDEKAPYYVTKYLTKEWDNKDSIFLRNKCKIRVVSWSRDLSKLWAQPAKKPTVSVHANVALAPPDFYKNLFRLEFPKGIKISLDNTYRRGHVWTIEHPNIHPYDLLRKAIPNIVFSGTDGALERYMLDATPLMDVNEDYIGMVETGGVHVNTWV